MVSEWDLQGSGPSTTPIIPPNLLALGVYVGNGNPTGNPANVATFASDTSTPVNIIQTYLSHTLGWGYLTSLASMTTWMAAWAGGISERMMIALPMVCLLSGTPQNTLAQGAAGTLNPYFQAIAQNFVALGFGNAIIRPGWEFNWGTSTYPWGVNNDADALNYAAFWRQLVSVMRAVPQAEFQFAWSIATASGINVAWPYTDAYPGDEYVDFLFTDVYDRSADTTMFPTPPGNTCTVAQSNLLWNFFLTGNDFGGSAANFLGPPDSGFETWTGHWVVDAHCTVAQSSAKAHTGTYSMAVTATGSSQFTAPQIKFINGFVPGQSYTVSFDALAGTTGRSWSIGVTWWEGDGSTQISSVTVAGAGTDNSSTWTLITATFVAPPLAAQITLFPSFTGSSPEVHYVDDVVIAGPLVSQGSLQWLAALGQTHGKGLGIAEWAVAAFADNSGLGDDPTFINNMNAWILANKVAVSCYFSQIVVAPDNYNLIGGSFPNALAAFAAADWVIP